jgi:hypothetical protein
MRWRGALGGLAAVVVVVGVIAGLLGMLPWQGPGPYGADDAATDALADDPTAAVALGERLLTEVPLGSCVPADQVDLGPLEGTQAWERVCRSGLGPGTWTVDVEAPNHGPALTYGPLGPIASCVQDAAGGWRSSHPMRVDDAVHPCEDGYQFTGSG